MEAGVLIRYDNTPIYWHTPVGRSSGSLPDSNELWNQIWNNRDHILGFAHSHPGSGIPRPSYEDVTTFAAIEAALGRRLVWWITSSDKVSIVNWQGPKKLEYVDTEAGYEPSWARELRNLSL